MLIKGELPYKLLKISKIRQKLQFTGILPSNSYASGFCDHSDKSRSIKRSQHTYKILISVSLITIENKLSWL